MERNLSDIFIEVYNEIDHYMRQLMGVDERISHTVLIDDIYRNHKNSIISRYRNELKTYAKLRNAIVHNPRKEGKTIAEPHKSIVEEYEKILNTIKNPPKALDKLGVRLEKLYSVDYDDSLLGILDEMDKNNFSHVPILEDKVLKGVFSENTLFSYIVKNREIIIDEELKLSEVEEYTYFSGHSSERFEFMKASSNVFDVIDKFKYDNDKDKKLAAVFITHNGRKNEKVLGMINAWDIIACNYK